jgi:hypothetical protein
MAALRREALESAPLSFGSSVEDDRFRSVQAIEQALGREDGHVYGLFLGPALVGMTGVYRIYECQGGPQGVCLGYVCQARGPSARRSDPPAGCGGSVRETMARYSSDSLVRD